MLVFQVQGTMSVFQVLGTVSVLQVLVRVLVFQFLVRVIVFQVLFIVLLPKPLQTSAIKCLGEKIPIGHDFVNKRITSASDAVIPLMYNGIYAYHFF
jgi:hypothetical protein